MHTNMASSPHSSQTFGRSSPPVEDVERKSLELGNLPPVYLLSAHLSANEVHQVEEYLVDCNALLTYDIKEARIVLTKVSTKRRAALELRSLGLWTEELVEAAQEEQCRNRESRVDQEADEPQRKKQRLEVDERLSPAAGDSQATMASVTEDEDAAHDVPHVHPILISDQSRTESEGGSVTPGMCDDDTQASSSFTLRQRKPIQNGVPQASTSVSSNPNAIKIVKLQWLNDSAKAGQPQPLHPYVVYNCKTVERPAEEKSQPMRISTQASPSKGTVVHNRTPPEQPAVAQTILDRAKADAEKAPRNRFDRSHDGPKKFGLKSGSRRFEDRTFAHTSHVAGNTHSQMAKLLQQSTTDYDPGADFDIPEPPEWVKKGIKYACQRSTPPNPPNNDFIEQLKKIREARTLTDDEIGVRAYSTSIAALAAYPYTISSARQILPIPGCDAKIANLWVEWKNNNGVIRAVVDADNDPSMKVLREFYNIWGVGASTARQFLFEHGWQDLDDIVQYGWSTLTRVQQIGVKYYDEFLAKIPRAEVESIASIIRHHGVLVRDEGIEVIIVGGYRRGKKESGDVDVIVSHRSLQATHNLVEDIVYSLEQEEYITHTLTLSKNSTNRGQATLPFHNGGGGHGFDTLDKALVVWQEPSWPTKEADRAANAKAKNPNIHRRVDIIISPWRTVGCAIQGWTSGTTFNRDIRRYARHVKGWKFDSSGVRDRRTGHVVQLEGPDGVDGTPVDAERKVFEGFGLEWREPWERNTG